MKQRKLRIVPTTLAKAQRFVQHVHRHHGPIPPSLHYFSLAVADDREHVRGVAIVGRPANRNSDTGWIAEVLRVATDGCPNACSALYGAAYQVAKRLGFSRVITYTLASESGTSLKAAGWSREADGIRSYWDKYDHDQRPVKPREHYATEKVRWACDLLNEPSDLVWPEVEDDDDGQLRLDMPGDAA